jgi:hypothetical protein
MNRRGLSLLLALTLVAAVAACTSPGPAVATKGGMALPFIENDYAQAVVRAREGNLPLFVEVWAPW